MKLNTIKIFYILICIIIISYLLYIIYNLLSSRLHNNINIINKFEDVPENTQNTSETTTPLVTSMSIPTDEQVQTCKANNNIVGFCMNYDGCCDQQTSENYTCFCKHPFVQDCKNTYDECKSTSSDKEECKTKLKDCCTAYNKININNSNFQEPIKQDQVSQKICSIGSLHGLSSDSMSLKCMELCQTNQNCKAFSIDKVNCILFSGINPLPTKLQNTSKTKTDYYIKK